jgi:uncharacterized protein YukE
MEQLKVQLKNMQEQVKKAAEKETQSQAYIKTLDSQNKVYQRTVESLTGKLEALDGKKAPANADEILKKELDKAKAVYDAEIKKRDQNLAELKAKLADVESKLQKLQKTSSSETHDLAEKLKELEIQKMKNEEKKQSELDSVREQLKK